MGDFPLVSIILPTYNGQQFISDSIDSILNQTYKNIELIIVDDASTDETPQIVKRFSNLDSRIKIINNPSNKKLPKSLNIGHKASSGEFITWTSDDNIYLRQAIERMVYYLLNHKDIGLVYTDYSTIDKEGNIINSFEVDDVSLLWKWSVVKCCFLYRRKVYEKVGEYSDEMRLVEDHDYWLRIHKVFKMQPLHENLYYYRMHDASLTSAFGQDVMGLKKKLTIKYLEDFELDDGFKKDQYLSILSSAINRREYKQIIELFLIFFWKYPIKAIKWGSSRFISKLYRTLKYFLQVIFDK